jgi:hypothetical protein
MGKIGRKEAIKKEKKPGVNMKELFYFLFFPPSL